MEKIKLIVFLIILSLTTFGIADNVVASGCIVAKPSILPDCLAKLTKTNLMEMFLSIEDENKTKIWHTPNFVEESFFSKITAKNFSFINDFLKTTENVPTQQFPIEALIWAYSKDSDELNLVEAKVMGLLYDKSRRGQIIPRSPKNIGVAKVVDTILDTYFSSLRAQNMVVLENSVKQKIVILIETEVGKTDDVVGFLSNFYAGYEYNGSHIIRSIGRAVYGLNSVLESTVHEYVNSILHKDVANFLYKTKGVQFGRIVRLRDEKKFFVKAHQNYPYTGKGQTLTGNQLSGAANDSTSIRSDTIRPVYSVDLKELFAYKVLEHIGFGAKTHFILNENLIGDLYIATEEVDNFVTLGSFERERENHEVFQKFKTKFMQLSSKIMKDGFIATGQDDEDIIVKLTAFDLIARSMLLSDLNEENIGFVLNPIEGNSVKIVDFMRPVASKILDMNRMYLRFLRGEMAEEARSLVKRSRYLYLDINESFLEVDTFTKYPDILLKGVFKPSLNPEDPDYEDYMMKFNRQKNLLVF